MLRAVGQLDQFAKDTFALETPHMRALQALASAGWIDAWADRHAGDCGGTWPAGVPRRRIDYVWVQPGVGWEIASSRRSEVSGSDHVGLVAIVRF
jgi:endonuclease/exonuclease/phosphatase family metal-dependent hydrolase